MPHYICVTCGTQFAASDAPPPNCPICEDERQYVNWDGQQWTTLDDLRTTHRTVIKPVEPNLTGIGMEPGFAINQRALLVQTPHGNVLWDCITTIDDAAIEAIQALGGIDAMAISHPHYYSSMVEWSHAFDAPIYLHADEREWVMRPDDAIVFWQGETHALWDGITLIRCGGHFDGAQVLHWAAGADGKSALLAGDVIMVANDRAHVTFMYSYPNYIPLSASKVRRIVAAVEPFAYDRIYAAWWNRTIFTDAKAAVKRSAERYIKAIAE
ncbi:MAG: MBL fold metallo-hydrolase [Chloroflexi bacterium]|nr:MAG: MBL fold metallo-hydrolase [Chloroflexota bacterium]